MKFSLRLLELEADLATAIRTRSRTYRMVSRWIESCCDVSRETLTVEVSQ